MSSNTKTKRKTKPPPPPFPSPKPISKAVSSSIRSLDSDLSYSLDYDSPKLSYSSLKKTQPRDTDLDSMTMTTTPTPMPTTDENSTTATSTEAVDVNGNANVNANANATSDIPEEASIGSSGSGSSSSSTPTPTFTSTSNGGVYDLTPFVPDMDDTPLEGGEVSQTDNDDDNDNDNDNDNDSEQNINGNDENSANVNVNPNGTIKMKRVDTGEESLLGHDPDECETTFQEQLSRIELYNSFSRVVDPDSDSDNDADDNDNGDDIVKKKLNSNGMMQVTSDKDTKTDGEEEAMPIPSVFDGIVEGIMQESDDDDDEGGKEFRETAAQTTAHSEYSGLVDIDDDDDEGDDIDDCKFTNLINQTRPTDVNVAVDTNGFSTEVVTVDVLSNGSETEAGPGDLNLKAQLDDTFGSFGTFEQFSIPAHENTGEGKSEGKVEVEGSSTNNNENENATSNTNENTFTVSDNIKMNMNVPAVNSNNSKDRSKSQGATDENTDMLEDVDPDADSTQDSNSNQEQRQMQTDSEPQHQQEEEEVRQSASASVNPAGAGSVPSASSPFATFVPLLKPPPVEKMQAFLRSQGFIQGQGQQQPTVETSPFETSAFSSFPVEANDKEKEFKGGDDDNDDIAKKEKEDIRRIRTEFGFASMTMSADAPRLDCLSFFEKAESGDTFGADVGANMNATFSRDSSCNDAYGSEIIAVDDSSPSDNVVAVGPTSSFEILTFRSGGINGNTTISANANVASQKLEDETEAVAKSTLSSSDSSSDGPEHTLASVAEGATTSASTNAADENEMPTNSSNHDNDDTDIHSNASDLRKHQNCEDEKKKGSEFDDDNNEQSQIESSTSTEKLHPREPEAVQNIPTLGSEEKADSASASGNDNKSDAAPTLAETIFSSKSPSSPPHQTQKALLHVNQNDEKGNSALEAVDTVSANPINETLSGDCDEDDGDNKSLPESESATQIQPLIKELAGMKMNSKCSPMAQLDVSNKCVQRVSDPLCKDAEFNEYSFCSSDGQFPQLPDKYSVDEDAGDKSVGLEAPNDTDKVDTIDEERSAQTSSQDKSNDSTKQMHISPASDAKTDAVDYEDIDKYSNIAENQIAWRHCSPQRRPSLNPANSAAPVTPSCKNSSMGSLDADARKGTIREDGLSVSFHSASSERDDLAKEKNESLPSKLPPRSPGPVIRSPSKSKSFEAVEDRGKRSGSFEFQPSSPKIAETIAIANSRAEKKLNELMLSLSTSKSGEGEQLEKFLGSSEIGSTKKLSRGAFATASNSTEACISPKVSFETDDDDEPDMSPQFNTPFGEGERSAAVEVQLSPRPTDKESMLEDCSPLFLYGWAHSICSSEDKKLKHDSSPDHISMDESLIQLKELFNERETANNIFRHVTEQTKKLNGVYDQNEDDDEHLDANDIADEVKNSMDVDRDHLRDAALILLRGTEKLYPFRLPEPSKRTRTFTRSVISADFGIFLRKISQVSGIDLPKISASSTPSANGEKRTESCGVFEAIFGNSTDEYFINTIYFLYRASNKNKSTPIPSPPELHGNVYQTDNAIIYDHSTSTDIMNYNSRPTTEEAEEDLCVTPNPSTVDRKNPYADCTTTKRRNRRSRTGQNFLEVSTSVVFPTPPALQPYYNTPKNSPCPFEIAVWTAPTVVLNVLEYLGDPVAVCRIKMVNNFCSRIIAENEYQAMKVAVRLGGLPTYLRPAFWMWITLEKCSNLKIEVRPINKTAEGDSSNYQNDQDEQQTQEPCVLATCDFIQLEQKGRESKWHHAIMRDVVRAFGNLPPHKSKGSRRKSIVRALVSWGRSHLNKSNPNPGGKETPIRSMTVSPSSRVSRKHMSFDSLSLGQSDTVSDWGGISPVGSNMSSAGSLARTDSLDMVLGGNALSSDVKADLQKKLEAILNAMAAAHPGVGYCQGMDYIVAHLLRVLQETVEWNLPRGKLPPCVESAMIWAENKKVPLHETLVVEETIFQVMDTLMSVYGLRHMYWPELRCLKTCCRVFESIIEKKLPVLYDHFEHHELNIGLFALGWFQTMFLYIPSMPSKTINHIWDIMLVERSFKIFFRVGTAILFLSQPILLNNELEGMMQYLNTFPDATILTHDILINCALQIKITNSMLAEIESWVVMKNEVAHGLRDGGLHE